MIWVTAYKVREPGTGSTNTAISLFRKDRGRGLDYSLEDLLQRRVQLLYPVHAEFWYVLPRRSHLALWLPLCLGGVPTEIGQRLQPRTHPRRANDPRPREAAVQGSVP